MKTLCFDVHQQIGVRQISYKNECLQQSSFTVSLTKHCEQEIKMKVFLVVVFAIGLAKGIGLWSVPFHFKLLTS